MARVRIAELFFLSLWLVIQAQNARSWTDPDPLPTGPGASPPVIRAIYITEIQDYIRQNLACGEPTNFTPIPPETIIGASFILELQSALLDPKVKIITTLTAPPQPPADILPLAQYVNELRVAASSAKCADVACIASTATGGCGQKGCASYERPLTTSYSGSGCTQPSKTTCQVDTGPGSCCAFSGSWNTTNEGSCGSGNCDPYSVPVTINVTYPPACGLSSYSYTSCTTKNYCCASYTFNQPSDAWVPTYSPACPTFTNVDMAASSVWVIGFDPGGWQWTFPACPIGNGWYSCNYWVATGLAGTVTCCGQ